MQISTRRQFLGSAFAAGTLLASGFFGPVGRSRARGKDGTTAQIGVALLGLGSYSTEELAPALQRTRFCRLTGIVTGTPAKIPVWQARHHIPDRNVYDYQSLPRIANDDDIQVVYVVVPPSLHAKYAIMAAEAGKHVWCEKPMAMSVQECQRIIDACRKNHVKLSIGYRMRHERDTRAVTKLARERAYGDLKDVRARAGFGGGANGWRLQKSMGGGALYDIGVYCIEGIRYASGREPLRVTRAMQRANARAGADAADDTSEFELELPGGARAVGKTSFVEEMNELHADCGSGWYELAPFQTYRGVRGRTSDGKKLAPSPENQQARQMDDDARAILDGRDVLVPGEEGMRDIRIVQAIAQAARTQMPVSI